MNSAFRQHLVNPLTPEVTTYDEVGGWVVTVKQYQLRGVLHVTRALLFQQRAKAEMYWAGLSGDMI